MRRWKKSMAYGVIFTGAFATALLTGTYGALMALPGGGFLIQVPTWYDIIRSKRRIVARISQPDGSQAVVRGKHIGKARLRTHPTDGWALSVVHEGGQDQLRGAEAFHVAGPILAQLNREGGRRKTVESALAKLAAFPDAGQLFRHHAEASRYAAGDWTSNSLVEGSRADRLALEMVAHDEIERQAFEGELNYLERAWKEAEAIASIADNLLLPPAVMDRFRTLRADP